VVMSLILGVMAVLLFGFSRCLCKKDELSCGNWLPTSNNLAKREFEIFALKYTAVWIGIFACVVVSQAYETFTAHSYLALCLGLALPFLLQPILFPLPAESTLPLFMRYSFKANVWIFIFSFIGNYWYTHYFYSVLGAAYLFPAHRLNDVPIPLFFATHFYFVTYHTISNLLLRKIESKYVEGWLRTVFFWMVVVAFSYFTAFMETLSISSFPYYAFKDRFMAYTLGSAFYGIYFLVSYPVFYRLDEKVTKNSPPASLTSTILEAMGAGMIVLILLDLCRLALGIPLNISGQLYYLYQPGSK